MLRELSLVSFVGGLLSGLALTLFGSGGVWDTLAVVALVVPLGVWWISYAVSPASGTTVSAIEWLFDGQTVPTSPEELSTEELVRERERIWAMYSGRGEGLIEWLGEGLDARTGYRDALGIASTADVEARLEELQVELERRSDEGESAG